MKVGRKMIIRKGRGGKGGGEGKGGDVNEKLRKKGSFYKRY